MRPIVSKFSENEYRVYLGVPLMLESEMRYGLWFRLLPETLLLGINIGIGFRF
jgi:hypothetical protein